QAKVVGQPVAVGWRVEDRAPQFAVSRAGTLVIAPVSNDPPWRLAWASHDGRIVALPASLQHLIAPSLSADGRQIAALALDDGRADVWSGDVERGALSRVTFDGEQRAPVSSADGRAIVFASRVAGVFNLFARTLDGAAPRRLSSTPRHHTS